MKVLASLLVCAVLALAEAGKPGSAGCKSSVGSSGSSSATVAPAVGADGDDSSASSSLTPTTAPSSSGDDEYSGSSDSSESGGKGDASVGDEDDYSASTASSASGSAASNFTAVKSIQVRVQGNQPYWRSDYNVFTSGYYDDFAVDYRAVLDTVNMAAVEGAFKYVQAECINASVVTNCTRKNSIKYVAFYETTVVQPEAAMGYYSDDSSAYAPEHCPFMAMDGGQCDPNADGTFPDTCNQYIGADGQPELGFCVGSTLQDSEVLAPYPHNYWFSYPNSCPQSKWADKTDACRAEQAGGLCAYGVEPDGVNCTFSYKILGYVLLDDVVGITSMVNPNTLTFYEDYYEFCEAGGVEFEATVVGDLVTLLEGLPFWANPGDSIANAARATALVTAYELAVATNALTEDGGTMETLPTIASLTASNPPCYQNSVLCAEAEYGCKRSYYSQVCEVCGATDVGCDKP